MASAELVWLTMPGLEVQWNINKWMIDPLRMCVVGFTPCLNFGMPDKTLRYIVCCTGNIFSPFLGHSSSLKLSKHSPQLGCTFSVTVIVALFDRHKRT